MSRGLELLFAAICPDQKDIAEEYQRQILNEEAPPVIVYLPTPTY